MPKAAPLNNDKPAPVKPAAKPVPITPVAAPPAPQPAAMEKVDPRQVQAMQKAAQAVKLPAWLQTSKMPETSDRQQGGFVGFAATQSKKWQEMQAAGLNDGQPYLYNEQRYIPLQSVDFFLCAGESFQTLMVGQDGKFRWVSRDLEEQGPTAGTNRPEPHYVCLLIVQAEGRLIPIKGDFRGTKSGGIEGAIRAVEAAESPEWLKHSDAHKVSAAFPVPFGRVFHRITTSRQVGKTSGNAYFRANCVSNPATVSQMQMLLDAMADTEFSAALAEAKVNYDARVAFLDKIATEGVPAA